MLFFIISGALCFLMILKDICFVFSTFLTNKATLLFVYFTFAEKIIFFIFLSYPRIRSYSFEDLYFTILKFNANVQIPYRLLVSKEKKIIVFWHMFNFPHKNVELFVFMLIWALTRERENVRQKKIFLQYYLMLTKQFFKYINNLINFQVQSPKIKNSSTEVGIHCTIRFTTVALF